MKTHFAISTRLLLMGLLLMGAGTLFGQAPRTMHFQGVLIDGAGNPYADGSYTLTFKLYDAGTGGSQVWTETQVGVPVADGVFSVTLGSTNPFDESTDFLHARWLEVTQGATTFPRQTLTASPYAMGLSLPIEAEVDAGTAGDAGLMITNTSASSSTYGVYGESVGGRAIYGRATATAGQTYGVYGLNNSSAGYGVFGSVSAASGTNYAVAGLVQSSSGYAGHFRGGKGVYVENKLGVGTDNPGDQVEIIAPPGRDLLRVRIDGVGTKLRVHDNGGMSVGVNSTPPPDGLLVEGDIKYRQPQTRWLTVQVFDEVPAELDPVYLPHGAVITKFRAFVDDSHIAKSVDISLIRTEFGNSATSTTMASVATTITGTPGIVILTDTTINNATVDNENFGYYIASVVLVGGASIDVIAAQIEYTTTSPLY